MKGKWKLVKSCLASVLCACLIVSCMGNMTVAFAGKWDEVPAGKTVNYVSLGDSMTNGLGLPGYKTGGYLEVAPDAYPAQVAEHYGWSLTQLATSGMRAEDLHYILTYGKEGGYPGDAWMEHELLDTGRWADLDEVAATFQTAIAQADVISAAMGNANFSVFFPALIPSITGAVTNGIDLSFATKENGLAGLDPDLKALVMDIYDGVMKYALTVLSEEMAEELGDAVIFTVASYMRNYNRALDRIVELNPDVEIIIYGLFNTEAGFEVDVVYEGQEHHISMADLRELIVQPINTYLAGWATVKQGMAGYEQATIYYAEAEPVKTLATTFTEVYKDDESVIRERFVTDVVKTVFPMVEMDLVDITLDDVKAYEAAFEAGISALAAYEQQSAGKAMSAAIYLAVEGAILNALDKDVFIDVDEMMAISGGKLGVDSIGDLMGNITDELQSIVFANAMEKMDQVAAELPGADTDAVAKIALLYVTTESVQAAFESDEMITAVLSLYGHTKLASGISNHPNAEGHDQLTDAIIEAYTGEHTGADEVVNKVFETLRMLKTLRDAPNGPGKQGDYVLYEDSYYVAIDELYAEDYGYADKVAAELGIPYAKIAEVDEEEVAKADLITVRYNNEPMIGQMIQDAKNYKKVQPKDWTVYLGEEGAAFIQNTLAEVEAMLDEMNLGTMKDMAMTAVESYAYECTGQMIGYLKDLKAIAAINPEALIVSVSMNNSLEDVVLVMGEQELALGKYLGYVVEAANMEAYAYVLMSENTVYVPANEVATDYNAEDNAGAMDFILSLIDEDDRAVLKANAAGHEYIKERILNALTVSVYQPEEEEPEVPGMKGDLDKNGVVDIDDVLLCLDLCFTTPTAEDYAVADLDANAVIDIDDVLLCLDLCF